MIGGWARVWLWAVMGIGLALRRLAAYGAAAAAQIGAAALAGRIVDQKGGALPGTTVTVVSVATGLSRTVAAGTDGEVRRSGAASRHLSAACRVERLPAAGA